MNKNINFTEGKIAPSLIKFAIPLMMALVLQALYGTVDLIIVGYFGDPESISVSAVAQGSQIMHMVTVLVTGLTMGMTVKIGQYVGANDYKKLADTIGSAIYLFGIIIVLITVTMLTLVNQISVWTNIPTVAVEKYIQYVTVCSMGIVFIVAYNVISGIFRGMGDSKKPLLFIGIACGVNIIADLVFVGIFKLDAIGAALATVLAQAVSVVFSLIMIKRKGFFFEFKRDNIKFNKKRIKGMLKVGGPIALQDGLTAFSFIIIAAIINSTNIVSDSASIGISEKIFMILSIVSMAFMSAISTVVAQNVGANKNRRAMNVLFTGMKISGIFGIATFIMAFFGGELLARIFVDSPEVIYTTGIYLKATSFEYLLTSISFCMVGYLNGNRCSTFNMILNLSVAFFIRIPLSYIFRIIEGSSMFTIGLAVPISAFISLIFLSIYLVYILRKKQLIGKNKLI